MSVVDPVHILVCCTMTNTTWWTTTGRRPSPQQSQMELVGLQPGWALVKAFLFEEQMTPIEFFRKSTIVQPTYTYPSLV
jgi:hypothetical protein